MADGFHCCQVAPEHRCYVTFRLRGQLLRHAVLPFGYSGSPAVFGRIMKVFTRLIRAPDVPASLDKAGPPRFPRNTPAETLRAILSGSKDEMTPADWMMLRDAVMRRAPVHYNPARCLPYCDDYLFLFPSRIAALAGAEVVRQVLSSWCPVFPLTFPVLHTASR